MAGPKIYAGVGGKARQINNIYVGVSGKARKIKKAYVGVGGKARLIYVQRWWLPSGMAEANCLAAYQFKGATSETEALRDLTGHGYNLTKTANGSNVPTWSSASGFKFADAYGGGSGYLDNATLDTKGIYCAIVRYTGLTRTSRGYLVTAGGSTKLAHLYAATTVYDWDGDIQEKTGPGYVVSSRSIARSETAVTSGVVGANFGTQNNLYVNGTKTGVGYNNDADSSVTVQGVTFGNSHANKSPLNNANHAGKTIIAAAIYSVALTEAQHKDVYNKIVAI